MGLTRSVAVGLCAVLLSFTTARAVGAADTWTEVKSPHFTVWSMWGWCDSHAGVAVRADSQCDDHPVPVGEGRSRLKPMVVIAAKDEPAMKALAPKYWEQRGGIRPGSVWVSGADRHYIDPCRSSRGRHQFRQSLHQFVIFVCEPDHRGQFQSPAAAVVLERPRRRVEQHDRAQQLHPARPPHSLASGRTTARSAIFLEATREHHGRISRYVRESGRERFDAPGLGVRPSADVWRERQVPDRHQPLLLSSRRRQGCRRGIRGNDGPVSTLESSFASYINSSLYITNAPRWTGR